MDDSGGNRVGLHLRDQYFLRTTGADDQVKQHPTAKELGYKFDVNSWLALGTPKGVPKPTLDKLRDAFKKAIDDPEFVEIMDRIYIPPAYKTPEEYKNLVEAGYKESEAMIRELGLHKSQQKK